MLTDIFVYGGLRRGMNGHFVLEGRSFFKGYAQTVKTYPLFHADGNPGACDFRGDHLIFGEVYAITVDTLIEIDQRNIKSSPNYLPCRKLIPVRLHNQVVYAWITFAPDAVMYSAFVRPVPGGDWVRYRQSLR